MIINYMKIFNKRFFLSLISLTFVFLYSIPSSYGVVDKSKIGITRDQGFALIRISYTSGKSSPARGVAVIENIDKKRASGNFEITMLDKDNKTPMYNLYGTVKKLSPGKRAEVIFKSRKEPLPDRLFIFHFRTVVKKFE